MDLQQVVVPRPGRGQILVKIDSSPINPSDNSFIRGLYRTRKVLPVIAGFEASGTVVATGNDLMSKRLLGKRVACFAPTDGHGTWAEYMVTGKNSAIPLKKEVDMEQGSMLLVNPLSVMAMVDIAKKRKCRAIANTAAASALGQMLNRVCIDKKLPLVNIVRREDQVKLLKDQGAKYVLNSASRGFKDELASVFSQLEVTLVFDAIAGQMTFDLSEAIPVDSEIMIYGGLSEQPAFIHPGKLIFERKKVSGFWLSEWITHQPLLKLLFIFNKIQKYVSATHHTKIQKRVSLSGVEDGLKLYLENMTAGKILVKPSDENL
jgi:NADPH:quinone reductase-like Zn-dependent oxidoreductase